MLIVRYFFLMLVLLTTMLGTVAQEIKRYNVFSYSVNEGLLQSTIHDLAFDNNNFYWISFPNGIQKFDGKTFTVVPIQPGLPDDKSVQFFQCSNGDLLLSHSAGISRYDLPSNRFSLLYKNSPSAEKPSVFIGEQEEAIFFYTAAGHIAALNNKSYQLQFTLPTGQAGFMENEINRPRLSRNIVDNVVAFSIKSSIYLWDLKARKIVAQSDPIRFLSAYFLELRSRTSVMFCSFEPNGGLQLYNFTTKTITPHSIAGMTKARPISRCTFTPWHHSPIISFNNRVWEVDTALTSIQSELVNFQNQPVAAEATISKVVADKRGNLCIVTVTGGIKKLIRNSYPIKYYRSTKAENNNILSVMPDKQNNRILAGTTGNGLLVFDTLQQLVKHIKQLPGMGKYFAPNSILKDPAGGYYLFNNGEKDVWVLNKDLTLRKKIAIATTLPEEKRGIPYFGNVLWQNGYSALTQSQGRIYKINFKHSSVTETEIIQGYTMGGIRTSNNIITHSNDELYFVDVNSLALKKKIPFKNTGGVRCFAGNAQGIYLGSNKGIFKIDEQGKILLHVTRQQGLPDECIYAIAIDEDGILWCSSNKGIFKLDKSLNLLQLQKEDGLQENEFNTNVVAAAPDGELFFGGVNGISSFYPRRIASTPEKLDLLFTKIKINNQEAFTDTGISTIEAIKLPHWQNSVSFDFIAVGNNNPDQYIYQYRMDGIDTGWLQNNDLQTVRYLLPPGKYIFKISASQLFDRNATALRSVEITILPPFWETWWFIGGVALLLLLIPAYIINNYARQRYRKKLGEIKTEHRVQLERERISRDLHDSIGAYANAVLYKTELLEKEEHPNAKLNLMSDLKFASKDIITSLRETIWALKKEVYTAQDCIMRIRNFVQPLGRYYPHISFSIEEETAAEIPMHYSKALNVVRILQEAVTNAIKHSNARHISIKSSQQNSSWQLEVADDGIGFLESSLEGTEQGDGLVNMKERAVEAAFDLQIISSPGAGTKLIITI